MGRGVALAVLIAFPSPAFAFAVTAEQRAACEPDVYRLCASAVPNIGKIIACMKKEKPNLSSACRTVVEAAEQEVATRSLATPESEWCQFSHATQTPAESDWLKWCGPAAQY